MTGDAVKEVGRILVVDDEESLRGIISSMLILAGYQCRAFAGGLDALALLESGAKFDLVLTDLLNAPVDGLSLLERMKEKFPNISVVMVTTIRVKHLFLNAFAAVLASTYQSPLNASNCWPSSIMY